MAVKALQCVHVRALRLKSLKVGGRLSLQLGQLASAVGNQQGFAGRMKRNRAVADGIAFVQLQLAIRIARVHGLKVVDPTEGQPTLHGAHGHGREVSAC